MKKAFFLDKDGVFVVQNKYKKHIISKDEIMPESIEGLKLIANSDYLCIPISNQGWIGTGRLTLEEVASIFESVKQKVSDLGGRIDDYYFCPHVTKNNCECRKPKPGMILQAAKKYNIDLSQSYMIGDSTTDILAGKNAGTKTALVLTGYGGEDGKCIVTPDIVGENLTDVVRKILTNKN